MPKVLDKQWKVLKEAKKYLRHDPEPFYWEGEEKSGKFKYICHAIGYVVTGVPTYVCPEKLYVEDLLGDEYALEYWLVENDYATWDEIDSPEGEIKMQTTRHAWIDWMIKDCKKRNI